MKNYNKLVPQDSFLGRYLRYMLAQETAYSFDFWGGLWCIGAACGRETYVDRPRAPVYLNMFTIFVGESGVARKTTSVLTASKFVRPVVDRAGKAYFLDAKMTPEVLDKLLHDRTAEIGCGQMCIAVSELAVFLGTERYIAHMPTLLTDLYDCPDVRTGGGTIARGEVFQKAVWLHFLSASTPIWLLKTVNPNVVEGGFTSRCYFVVSNEPKRKIIWPDATDTDLYKDICDDLLIIATEAASHGPIEVSDSGKSAAHQWYSNRQHSIDPFKQSFEAREDAHVLRIAALLSINDGSWLIKRSHINVAIQLLKELKETSGSIFANSQARTKIAVGFDTLRSHLVSAGMDPIPRHHLYRKCRHHLDHLEFIQLLELLEELGAIQRFRVDQERGRPTDYIRGTNKILSRGMGEIIINKFT